MDDLLSEFLTESNESISVLDAEVVRLEQNPNDQELIANIFRLVHTIKGTCGFLGLPRLESVAHAAENVLGKLRDVELEVTPVAVTLVLESFDKIKEIMAELEATEAEPAGDDADLIRRLDALIEDGDGSPAPDTACESAALRPGEISLDELEAAFEAAQGPAEQEAEVEADAASADDESLYAKIGGEAAVDAAVDTFYRKVLEDENINRFFDNVDMDAQRAKQKAFLTMVFGGPNEYTGKDLAEAHAHLVADGLNDSHFDAVAGHLSATLEELGVAPELASEVMTIAASTRDDVLGHGKQAAEAPAAADQAQAAAASDGGQKPARSTESSLANQSIRVNVELLEDLMNLVSELVLTRNQLMQMVRGHTDSEFAVPLQRLSHVTTDLQEGVMKTRMQPIGNAWAKLPRIVRDLAVDLGKKIDLQMLGADTELDRQVLELIKDPLTHMVRNSGDHGLETPAERVKAGKPETGRITLNAYHEGGHIIIEISDDGAGISIENVKAKALKQGLITEAELAELSDKQIQQFIFRAGFSTAAKVTNVSGRGVGMDVVRTNIEKIGGTVELSTEEGKGSTFTIKIPLTLAIVSALIVEAAGERFAIPQIAVSSLVRVSATSEHRIESINETPVLRLRNRLLPLVLLGSVLQLSDDAEAGVDSNSDAFVVVSQVGNYSFGIIVDRVFDTEEIVVKPVAPILRGINIFSGNTILGDGSVIMILDPNGMATATGEVSFADSHATTEAETRASHGDDRTALLVFRAGGTEPKVVPLGLVARLEEIAVDAIEMSNGRQVVQYRGRLMPLIKVDDSYAMKSEGRQPVLVFSDGKQSMGLVVDEIVDIVEADLDIELAAEHAGRIGSVVVDGKATELLDTSYFLKEAFGNWFDGASPDSEVNRDTKQRILLVDDSPFFRNMLTPLLAAAGYKVTVVEGADDALKLREEGSEFDVIVSDIEMPGMDGFEFMEAVKNDARWQDTPVVALSSRTTTADFQRGRQVGFTDYIGKFDRDTLLNTLSQTLSTRMERGAA
jgi:two-component system chemotaxis sensor kinase CheA